MTILQIKMLLHYYCIAEPYGANDPVHANSSAVLEQRNWLLRQGLIEFVGNESPSNYIMTERGRIYVEALKAMPLPECKWFIPTAA